MRSFNLKEDGQCITCGIMTLDDGEGCDPRGVCGLRASAPLVASEFGCEGADVPRCYGCSQDERKYNMGVARAKAKWAANKLDPYSPDPVDLLNDRVRWTCPYVYAGKISDTLYACANLLVSDQTQLHAELRDKPQTRRLWQALNNLSDDFLWLGAVAARHLVKSGLVPKDGPAYVFLTRLTPVLKKYDIRSYESVHWVPTIERVPQTMSEAVEQHAIKNGLPVEHVRASRHPSDFSGVLVDERFDLYRPKGTKS